MTRYVAVCCRISVDRRGHKEGVKAQEKWGRDYAASAWPDLPVEVFADPDVSAANGDHRPEHERFRQWLADGRIAHVWAVEQSRLERGEVEWFQLAAELDAAGIGEVHTNRDGILRVRDEIAGIKAVLNAGEVRKLKRRINDRLAELAAEGSAPGGGQRFGYRNVVRDDGVKTLQIIPEQAEVIRESAGKILDGWGLGSIAKELNERGVRGPRGGKIGTNTITWWLSSPTVAGHRVHQGHIVAAGNWDAILDENTWQSVKAKLAQPRRVKRADGGTSEITQKFFGHSGGRKYLITGGIAVCGVCGFQLTGSSKKIGGRSVPYLACHSKNGGGSCVGILLEPTERHVVDELFAELDKPEFLDAIAADDQVQLREQITGDLSGLEVQRNELAEMWAQRALTASEWTTARRALAEQEQRLRADLAAIPPPMSNVSIGDARQAWPSMTLEEQREFLLLFIDRVTIGRGQRGRRGIDTSRITIEWRAL